MRINRNHERRYYHHPGEWYLGIGSSARVWVRVQITTPRHRANFEVWKGANLPWQDEVKRKARASYG